MHFLLYVGIFNSFKARVAGKKAGPDQALAYQLRLALLAAGYRAGLVPDPAFGAHASPLRSKEEATPPEHTGSSSQGLAPAGVAIWVLGAEWQQPRVAHPCLPLRPAVGLEYRLTPPANLDQSLQWEALNALSRVVSSLRPLRLEIVLPSVHWTFPGGCAVTSQASPCRRTPSMHSGVLPPRWGPRSHMEDSLFWGQSC